MRVPRLFLARPLAVGARVTLEEAASNHLLRVLRLKPGAPLRLFNGAGGEYEATLDAVERGTAIVTLGAFVDVSRESSLAITLAQGISRGERMDYTLQKSVELGVARILPLETEFGQVRLEGERRERRYRHWEGVIAGASEQSGRTRPPELLPITTLDRWLAAAPASGEGLRLALDPAAETTLGGLQLPPAGGVTLLIGPEGGLSDREIGQARRTGFIGLRLGPRILRTETAGIAALAALQVLRGDLG